MSAKSRKYELVALLPGELGTLIHWLRKMEGEQDKTSDAWADAAGRALHAAKLAFWHAVKSKDESVLLTIASPALVKSQPEGWHEPESDQKEPSHE